MIVVLTSRLIGPLNLGDTLAASWFCSQYLTLQYLCLHHMQLTSPAAIHYGDLRLIRIIPCGKGCTFNKDNSLVPVTLLDHDSTP